MTRQGARGYSACDILGDLWASRPAERESLRPYLARVKAYRSECGCTLGGAFAVSALAAFVVYGAAHRGQIVDHWLREGFLGFASVAGAALTGKLTGIGFARVRLALLGRELRRRYDARRG